MSLRLPGLLESKRIFTDTFGVFTELRQKDYFVSAQKLNSRKISQRRFNTKLINLFNLDYKAE